MKLNNKGFTLVEVLAVVAIIAILGLIAIPSVISTINTGKNTSYKIMISNIITGSQSLYEEIEYNGITLYEYDTDGVTSTILTINPSTPSISTNLQTLVSNGFLTGTNNDCTAISCINRNKKILIDPKTKEDIGDCGIIITKTIDGNGIVKYVITKQDTKAKCPSEYKEVSE